MWGIVPAAGQGSRMQPLAFSKELLPVGSRTEADRERPRAVARFIRAYAAQISRLPITVPTEATSRRGRPPSGRGDELQLCAPTPQEQTATRKPSDPLGA